MENLLREQGTDLFKKNNYTAALEKYTAAIAINSKNAVLYANRAACHSALCNWDQALADARMSVTIDPKYAKGWSRLASAQDALESYPDSIESLQIGLLTFSPPSRLTAAEKSQKQDYEAKLAAQIEKIMGPETMSVETLLALARAHDINVPTPHNKTNIKAIQEAVFSHPKMDKPPPFRLLLIPQSETEPLKNIELKFGPNINRDICRLLGCELSDAVVLHAEDQIAYEKGRPHGVGLGRLHCSYEAYMDDLAMSNRPLNKRACELLCRPHTHGPILVMKTTFIKRRADKKGNPEDLLCFEKLTEEELKSAKFKALREEWIKYMGTGDAPIVLEIRRL